MPNKKSAEKHLRADARKKARNKAAKSEMRTMIKKAERAIESGDVQAAQAAFRIAASKLDKAAKRGIIKKGMADRKKSRLAKRLNAMAKTEAA